MRTGGRNSFQVHFENQTKETKETKLVYVEIIDPDDKNKQRTVWGHLPIPTLVNLFLLAASSEAAV